MIQDIKIDKSSFSLLLEDYRSVVISFGVFAVSFLLLLFITMPQVNQLLQLREEEAAVQDKITTAQANLRLLSSLSDSLLDKDITLAIAAMPTEKDYVGFISAVTKASTKSKVALGDYTFRIGELATGSAKTTLRPSTGLRLAPPTRPGIPVDLSLNTGDIVGVQVFLTELAKNVPLSEVVSVTINGKKTSVSVMFYYRTLSPKQVVLGARLPPQTAKDQEILKNLATLDTKIVQVEFGPAASQSVVASPSGVSQ